MHQEIQAFNDNQVQPYREICNILAQSITQLLPVAESKIWHRHPVWFLDGNPTVGYSKQKPGIRLMFWSGASFEEALLQASKGKYKDASIFYNTPEEIDLNDLKRWIEKSRNIQWDYKNIYKRKGVLERLK